MAARLQRAGLAASTTDPETGNDRWAVLGYVGTRELLPRWDSHFPTVAETGRPQRTLPRSILLTEVVRLTPLGELKLVEVARVALAIAVCGTAVILPSLYPRKFSQARKQDLVSTRAI